MEAAGNQEESVRSRMESLRMNCDREIYMHQQHVACLLLSANRWNPSRQGLNSPSNIVSEPKELGAREDRPYITSNWALQLTALENGISALGENEGKREQLKGWTESSRHKQMTEPGTMLYDRGNTFPKLEFLDFDGTNLEDWVYRSERYFELEQTNETKKVRLASIYLYNKALQWHYTFIMNRRRGEMPGWPEYVEALTRRFGKAVFEDPMGRLKNLRQEGNCDNLYVYMEEFDSCLRKVLKRVALPEEFQISLFINGLKEEYRRTLWLLKPSSLLDTQSNARLLSSGVPSEQTIGGTLAMTGPSKGFQRSLIHHPNTRTQINRESGSRNQNFGSKHQEIRGHFGPSGNSQTARFGRRLSQDEINERRNKNLCFGCNEPYSKEHKCAKRQLYSMVLEPEEEELDEGDESTTIVPYIETMRSLRASLH